MLMPFRRRGSHPEKEFRHEHAPLDDRQPVRPRPRCRDDGRCRATPRPRPQPARPGRRTRHQLGKPARAGRAARALRRIAAGTGMAESVTNSRSRGTVTTSAATTATGIRATDCGTRRDVAGWISTTTRRARAVVAAPIGKTHRAGKVVLAPRRTATAVAAEAQYRNTTTARSPAVVFFTQSRLRYPRKRAITGATCASRPSTAPTRCNASASSTTLSARSVACPTLRPVRGCLP